MVPDARVSKAFVQSITVALERAFNTPSAAAKPAAR
jgi:hypothetical protein